MTTPPSLPSARSVASSQVHFVGLQISWRNGQTRTTVLSRAKARVTTWLVATRVSLRSFPPFAFLRSSVGHGTLPRPLEVELCRTLAFSHALPDLVESRPQAL